MGRWIFAVIMMTALMGLSLMSVGNAAEVEFTEAYLTDVTNITRGKKLWAKRCAFCHGKAAYPGSAPKLRAKRYQPTFVYDRITNGFRGMPPLKAEFSLEERRAIVAYVKSPGFKE